MKQVDLTNCDREPIHIPGSIQPFGFMLILSQEFVVLGASENVGQFIGKEIAKWKRVVQEANIKAE